MKFYENKNLKCEDNNNERIQNILIFMLRIKIYWKQITGEIYEGYLLYFAIWHPTVTICQLTALS